MEDDNSVSEIHTQSKEGHWTSPRCGSVKQLAGTKECERVSMQQKAGEGEGGQWAEP